MAIVFKKPINENKLRMAYNNDVIEFYSNVSLTIPTYCDVTLKNEVGDTEYNVTLRLYPAPDGVFFLNLKSFASALINKNRFQDMLNPEIDSLDPDSFVYAAESGAYLYQVLGITIFNQDNSTDSGGYGLRWIAGVEQIGDYQQFSSSGTAGVYMLSPLDKLTDNQYHLKYWEGYPFDIAIFTQNSKFRLKNNTNNLSQTFNSKAKVNRLVFSDGRTDETLMDVLPLVNGTNIVTLSQYLVNNPATDKNITLEKVPYKCGVYFKWFNHYGGYSYWLFENTFSLDRTSKAIGELQNDFDNLEDTISPTVQIGANSQDTIRVIAELLNEDDRRILLSIIDSPKVYMFTGQPQSRNSYYNWIEVSLKTTNVRIKNAKQDLTNFILDFDLPTRNTQTL